MTYAYDAETAERYGREASELTRLVGDLLGLDELTPFELRVLDRELPGRNGASTVNWYTQDGLQARYMRLGIEGRAESYRLIAHELVHWHVEHEWKLPLVIEEGLAEQIGDSFLSQGSEILDAFLKYAVEGILRDEPVLRGGRPLRIDRSDWSELNRHERLLLYGYGYLLVSRIGMDEIRELSLVELEQRAAEVRRAVLLPDTARSILDD